MIAGVPILAGYLLWSLFQLFDEGRRTKDETSVRPPSFVLHLGLKHVALLALCFAAWPLPWLFPLAQYARYGPFNGQDYGLPQHYFWGAPELWAQALDPLTGGPMRRGIFRAPTLDAVVAVLRRVGRRLLFEFGPMGVPLGLLGSIALLHRVRIAWLGAAWIFFATLAYLLLLGPAVQDVPVFTLPMSPPWRRDSSRKCGADRVGSAAFGDEGRPFNAAQVERTKDKGRGQLDTALSVFRSLVFGLSSAVVFRLSSCCLVAATLAWGYTRLDVSSKRQLWLFRRFGEATLDQLPPGRP